MSKVFITGATGQLGKSTINFLLQKGIAAKQISALARDEAKAAELKSKGIDVKIGNYDDFDSLRTAMQGVETMLLISSSEMTKSRAVQHINAIKAAKENGVKHIIYTGFMRTHEDPTSPLWFIAEDHVKTEKYLKESESFGEIAKHISEVTGVAINYVSPEPEVYQQTLMQHGVPEDYARMFTAFAVAFAADTMNISTTDLTQLLSRKPTTVQEYLLSKFKK